MSQVLQTTITRRMVPVIALSICAGALMLSRLIDVQLVHGEKYTQQADNNRFFTIHLPKERGILVDRYDQPLVRNTPVYYAVENGERIYTTKTLIDRPEALQLMSTASAQVAMEMTRSYPLGSAGSAVLGYTGLVTAEDIARDRSFSPRDIVGKLGLERKFNDQIRGQSSTQTVDITALGTKNRIISEKVGAPGAAVATTSDPYLTLRAAEALGESRGAVVVSDVATGAVLALVSSPSFDPSLLTARYADTQLEDARQNQVRGLFTDPRQLFFNRAVAGAYPPGSVFKLVTALAGLESSAFDAETSVLDEGVLKVGEYSYANWYFSQYGRVEGEISLQRALSRSNDIFFYKAAEWIGPDKLAEYARMFGLGARTGVELAGESAGFVPTTAWKEETIGEKWYLGNTYHFGIGQGDVLVTPLQVAQMTQTIANHGVKCQPTVTQHEVYECAGLGLNDQHLDLVTAGMLDACSTGGTAYPFFSWNEERRQSELPVYEQVFQSAAACKTGTAEFGGVTELNKRKTHGWFTMMLGSSFVAETATGSAALATTPAASSSAVLGQSTSQATSQEEHQQWLSLVKEHGFPEELTITVLVESDETVPYREGSKDAAPVAAALVKWMQDGTPVVKAKAETSVAPRSGEVLSE